jgi:hypothetical protein
MGCVRPVEDIEWLRRIVPAALGVVMAGLVIMTVGAPIKAQAPTLLLVDRYAVSFVGQPGGDERGEDTIRLVSTDQPIRWTAVVSPSVAWLNVVPPEGTAPPIGEAPAELTVYFQTIGLPAGTYTTDILISAGDEVANSPVVVEATLSVPAAVQRLYLPVVARGATGSLGPIPVEPSPGEVIGP